MDCISCATLQGNATPPGGILYQNEGWMFFLRSQPSLIAGQGLIILRRHCEEVAQLTPSEQATLGSMMQVVAQAYARTLQPERVHFGLYAEEVRHLHLHVLPRTAALPASNIRATFLSQWNSVLYQLRLKQPPSDAEVTQVADQLRQAFAQRG